MNLLPGLRDLRTPLATGYMWLLLLWLWFRHDFPTTIPQHGLEHDFSQLVDGIGKTAALAVLTFLAYLLGSLLENDLVTWLKTREMLRTISKPPKELLEYCQRIALPAMHLPDRDLITAASMSLDDARMNHFAAQLKEITQESDVLQGGWTRVRIVSGMLLLDITLNYRRLAIQLQVANATLFDSYDRLIAESQFRTNIALPLVPLSITLMFQASYWFVLGTLIAIVLAFQGWKKLGSAYQLVREALIAGAIITTVVTSLVQAIDRQDKAHQRAHAGENATSEHAQANES